MEKLLATGKTDLLQFVSARTKRRFSAFLVRQPDGKIGFEFEARDPTKGGARRARGGACGAYACWARIRATRSRSSSIRVAMART